MSESKKGKPIPWLNNDKKRTEKHRKNLSKSLKGRTSPNKGKTFSDEYKLKLSKSHKGQKTWITGKKHSDESKKKIREKRKLQVFSKESIEKRSKSLQKKVLQYQNSVLIKEWESIKKATEFFSPGRVNLIGEHTDYNGGNVFPCAIDKGTFALVKKREDNKFRMYSENFEHLGVIS